MVERASGEILSIIARALGQVTESTTYAQVTIDAAAAQVEADAILAKLRESGTNEIARMYAELARNRETWAKPFFDAREIEQVPVAENPVTAEMIVAGAAESAKLLESLARGTVVGIVQGNRLMSVRDAYVNTVSDAVAATRAGEEAYVAAVKRSVAQLANNGLRVEPGLEGQPLPRIRYASGRTQELHSVVRRDVMAGFRETVHEMDLELGRQFGADGWEVSAHALCAKDHLPYQGRRYTKKEMERIQDKLSRKLETGANCHHRLTPVILGINTPTYSKSELRDMKRYSDGKVTFRGLNGEERTMSRYEASQYQRSLENAARRYDGRAKLDKLAGIDNAEARAKLRNVRKVYREMMEATGLQSRPDRMRFEM